MTGRKEGENSPVKAFPTKNSPRFTCGQQQGGLSNRKLPSGSLLCELFPDSSMYHPYFLLHISATHLGLLEILFEQF